tara:strand:- start:847 stop:1116 length:270 start_codon:yes stop_codon:yes gene_type:complete
MPQLANDNTPYNPKMGDGSRGLVQFKKDGSDTGYLYGSINGTDYVLIHTFSASEMKELALPPYILIAGSATDPTVDLGTNSKAFLSETR